MHFSKALLRIVRTEYFLAATLVAIFFVVVGGFDWWWLIVLFPVFDLGMVGYAVNPRVGMFFYNMSHSIIGPVILVLLYIFLDTNWLLFGATVWLFHIFADRALGYGLKHASHFTHTHLGIIGKRKPKSV